MLKAAGLTAVFLVCSASGFLKSAELSKRVKQLESFIDAINLIATEIRYFASPVDVIMNKLDSLDEYKPLKIFGYCKDFMPESHDFEKVWSMSIESAMPKLALNKGDIEALRWFGSMLGATDVQGQKANCERYAELLKQRLAQAREEKANKGRMYSSLGILAGTFLFVVLF